MEVNMRSLIANVTSGRDCGELPGRTPRADARMAHRASPVRPGSPGSPPVSPKRHHTAAPHSMSAFAEKVQQSCAPDTLTAAEWFPTFQGQPAEEYWDKLSEFYSRDEKTGFSRYDANQYQLRQSASASSDVRPLRLDRSPTGMRSSAGFAASMAGSMDGSVTGSMDEVSLAASYKPVSPRRKGETVEAIMQPNPLFKHNGKARWTRQRAIAAAERRRFDLLPPKTKGEFNAAAKFGEHYHKTLGKLYESAKIERMPARSAAAAHGSSLYGPEIVTMRSAPAGSPFWQSMSQYYDDKSTAYDQRRCSTSLRVSTPDRPLRPLSRSMTTLKGHNRLGQLGKEGRLRTPDQMRRRSNLIPSPRRNRFQQEILNDVGQEWRFMVRKMPVKQAPDALREPVLIRTS